MWWNHSLECGHIEKRKRKARAEKVGCSLCYNPNEIQIDEAATLQQFELESAAKLALTFGIPVDAVSVRVAMEGGHPEVQGATVMLGREQIERMTT